VCGGGRVPTLISAAKAMKVLCNSP